ncbi:beta galactosidase jelly roll domain-containing protein, partial [Candidatus Sumerlaeota bacterium]|nr:beta galactosidase jelly roll domain-containing protein [Candidatus Sumerlaeota bacterium]
MRRVTWTVLLTVFAVIIVWGWSAGSSAATEQRDKVVSDYKYAWPRASDVSLNGHWQLAFTDSDASLSVTGGLENLAWFDTEVPTEVHWALYRAGKAPHPYVGLNISQMRWVEDKAWWFRRRFTAPKSFRAAQVRLVFEGVDYYARYWLNGRYLGRSEGAFGAVKFVITDLLRYGGENELIVRVECGGYKLGRPGGA